MPQPKSKAEEARALHRRIVIECAALVDLLNELYSPTNLPPLSSTDKEIGAWLGERRLVERLNALRKEAHKGTDGLAPVIRR